jgi:hypothetical protein
MSAHYYLARERAETLAGRLGGVLSSTQIHPMVRARSGNVSFRTLRKADD